MTNDVSPGAPVPTRPRWLYGVLIASLGVNLLMAGGALSAYMHHRHERGEHGLSGFIRGLPGERRDALRTYLDGEREKIKPMREEIRASWAETNALLGAEPFDKDKLKGAFARMNEAEGRMRAAIAAALIDTAEKLTPQERQAMKDWRQRQIERGRHKWRKHWGDEDERR